MNETVADIVREMLNTAEKQYDAFLNDPDDKPTRNEVSKAFISLAERIDAAHNAQLAKQRGINKELVDELDDQREHDRKLEADFAALYTEKERLRIEVEGWRKKTLEDFINKNAEKGETK